jgi:hypothetical protein
MKELLQSNIKSFIIHFKFKLSIIYNEDEYAMQRKNKKNRSDFTVTGPLSRDGKEA